MTRREKLFPPLSVTHMLALDRTYLNKFALTAKFCVSSLIDDLSNIDEYFFFVYSAVIIYNVPF